MNSQELKSDLPDNFEQLKKSVNRTSSWRDRLSAVEELGQWNNQQIIAILSQRLTNETVYKVQEAAYNKLKELGVDVSLPAKKKGDLIGGVTKVLVRVKKSLPRDHTYAQFKDKLNKMRLDVYDTYEGDKGAEFDVWLEQKWETLSTR